MTPNGEVHAVRNQSEYPRVERGLRRSIQRESPRTNFGVSLMGPHRYYHKSHFAWPGTFRTWVYSPAAIVSEHGYWGESFLRMQTQHELPHPSGLSDATPLGGAALAEVMNGER